MFLIDQLAEARIQEAIEQGKLDDLPGAGEPLPVDEALQMPEELRVAYRLLKTSGCLPPELELRKEISQVEELLVATTDAQEQRRAFVRLELLRQKLHAERGRAPDLRMEESYYQQLLARLDPQSGQARK